MKLPHSAWVVIVDGEKYLLLENSGDTEVIDLRVVDHDRIENPPTHMQGSDQPGRLSDAGLGKSAVNQTDWHELEKDRFAEDMADSLRQWALDGRFKCLFIVADPQTLGKLRIRYHPEVKSKIACELDKDLTNHPVNQIEIILRDA